MSQRKLRSYLYEGTMIVASILVAFALDASWANYQEDRVEQRILRELQEEMDSARTRIEASLAELKSVLTSTHAMIEHLGPDTIPMTPAEAEALLKAMLDLNTLEVPSSVLDSVVSSGQLGLISDVALRRALAEWPAPVADVTENHGWHREETDTVLIPAIAPYIALRNTSDGPMANSSSFALDPTPLQRDPGFEAMLVNRFSRQIATYSESETLLTATNDLIAMIDRNLD
jgi:hypothetical protein